MMTDGGSSPLQRRTPAEYCYIIDLIALAIDWACKRSSDLAKATVLRWTTTDEWESFYHTLLVGHLGFP